MLCHTRKQPATWQTFFKANDVNEMNGFTKNFSTNIDGRVSVGKSFSWVLTPHFVKHIRYTQYSIMKFRGSAIRRKCDLSAKYFLEYSRLTTGMCDYAILHVPYGSRDVWCYDNKFDIFYLIAWIKTVDKWRSNANDETLRYSQPLLCRQSPIPESRRYPHIFFSISSNL